MRRSLWMTAAIAALAAGALVAQPPAGCSDERSHQFDFWIGDWEVVADGAVAGHNRIEPILDGCVLQESWRGVKGSAGSSFNFFDPQRGKWRQLWVWKAGVTLELEGSYGNGRMVLEGVSRARDGSEVLNRITWYDNPDDTVRQHWEQSTDGGREWRTAFDGLYRQRG